MNRVVFERADVEGFRSQKVESIALSTAAGKRLFAGSTDGVLAHYECRTESALGSYGSTRPFSLNLVDNLRKNAKERKPVASLTVVEKWQALLGIVEGSIAAFDLSNHQQVAHLAETKGCSSFAIHEKSNTLAVATKRKLALYSWTGSTLVPKRDVSLSDTIKYLICAGDAIIVGFRRHYESLDLNSFAGSRLVEVDREHKMVGLELPATTLRRNSVILSVGLQGVIIDAGPLSNSAGAAAIGGPSYEERLEWCAAPQSMNRATPFLLTLLADSVEVHAEATLQSLQRIRLVQRVSGQTLSLATATYTTGIAQRDNSAVEESSELLVFFSTGDYIEALKMVPLKQQIGELVGIGACEDALSLCKLSPHPIHLKDVDVAAIHEKFAMMLFQKGDFEGAVSNYIAANTNPLIVLPLFPDLIPTALRAALGPKGNGSGEGSKLSREILLRAASAVVQYCEHYRPKVKKQALAAERIRGAGIGGMVDDIDELDLTVDPNQALKTAELLDTVYLNALLHCAPPRRAAAVDMLSSRNHCHLESCSVLLASQGNAFTEALLWLYRSHNEHRRVLSALTEDRCVGSGAWTKEVFYSWQAEYLKWLWFHETDTSLPQLALTSLRSVLEFDAELGLSVLTDRDTSNPTSSYGGKGVSVQEVVSFLETVNPNLRKGGPGGAIGAARRSALGIEKKESRFVCPLTKAGVMFPLVNGRSLGVAYLEWLVSSGNASAGIHDEYAQLLMEGIPFNLNQPVDHAANDLEIREGDDENLVVYKIYRRKLQHFLKTSSDYHPDRIMKFLPDLVQLYLHEYALLLSRLGRHQNVLMIYVHEIKDLKLAEEYCDRMYSPTVAGRCSSEDDVNGQINMRRATMLVDFGDTIDVYLLLIKAVIYSPESADEVITVKSFQTDTPVRKRCAVAVALAEKYYDRVDPAAVLELLPKTIPVAMIAKFLNIVFEFANTKKRNLQVVHQLLRVREVNLRTSLAGKEP
jgi:hypothetical protein